MKKVINGKLYNTDTAKRQAYWSNGANYGDFHWCSETLYRTRSGQYFIHGEGGAMSKYSESRGDNSWGSGEHIEPLSEAAAKSWAAEKLSGEEYISVFGEPEEA